LGYKKSLLEEIFICLKHLGLSYTDILRMPTYERRFFIVTLQNQLIDSEEESNKPKSSVRKTGKHTQVRTHSPT
jgi:hypothetical protein|tara:strand:- start:15022 stop:15243 length:222 start_codon:yes stop_codon:yes gene_type:complete